MDLGTVKRINESNKRFFVAIAGGGQSFIGDFTSISGASRSFVGGLVPYAQPIFDKFIKGVKVHSYASEEAARKLAVSAYNEVLGSGVGELAAVGLGAANSIVKDDERVGREHRFYIATHTAYKTRVLRVILQQGRDRQQEETMVSLFIFKMLQWEILGEPTNFQEYILPNETWEIMEDGQERFSLVVNGALDHLPVNTVIPQNITNLNVFCGSWNPYHEGHDEIFKLSQEILKGQTVLELTINNTDKGQLDFVDIGRRIAYVGERPLILTRARTFVDKTKMLLKNYPKAQITFIVGVDTWKRIWDAKYAGFPEDVEKVFESLNIKFLVFGRGHEKIYTGFGEHLRVQDPRAENFNSDISSTELRKKQNEH